MKAAALAAAVWLSATGARAACPMPFSVEAFIADVSTGRVAIPRRPASPVVPALILYHICRAAAASDAKACRPMKAVVSPITFQDFPQKEATHTPLMRCVSNYDNLRMGRAAADGGEGLYGLCRKYQDDHPVFKKGAEDRGCRAIEKHWKNLPGLCAEAAGLLDPGAKDCEQSLKELAGVPEACRRTPEKIAAAVCFGLADYRAGPKCAGDPLCLALRGAGPKACEAFLPEIEKAACPLYASPAPAKGRPAAP